nr:hypothetical protein [Sulfurimonas sp. SAG-AH-194-I05]
MKDLHLAVGDKEKIKYDINELVLKIPKNYQAKEEMTSVIVLEEW